MFGHERSVDSAELDSGVTVQRAIVLNGAVDRSPRIGEETGHLDEVWGFCLGLRTSLEIDCVTLLFVQSRELQEAQGRVSGVVVRFDE